MRVIIAALAIAILAIVGSVALEAALENAGEDNTISNETWTPNAGNVTELDDSNRNGAYYSHNVSVYDSTGTEVAPGDDYEWFTGNGTVKAVTGGALDGESSANITYSYQQTTEEHRTLAALLGRMPQLMGMALPVFLIVGLLAILRG